MPASPARYRLVVEQDPRYRWEAYRFVEESLLHAQQALRTSRRAQEKSASSDETPAAARRDETHLTGQELCEAMRLRALDQFGYLAKTVLSAWGVHCTSDFGEIVYNLIRIDMLKKSPGDRREDFDDVYDFDEAFLRGFRFTLKE